mgnify:CR=1 FL=1
MVITKKEMLKTAFSVADTLISEHSGAISTGWEYDAALALCGIAALYDISKDEKYFTYIKNSMEALIDPDGNVPAYNKEAYNLDFISPGNICFWLYDKTHNERYMKVIKQLKSQLKSQPRTESGVYFHKLIYPDQVWLDGIFMAQPFRAKYISRFEARHDFSDIVKQIQTAVSITYNPSHGLCVHACDESRRIFWADKKTGQSQNVWGRACGWLCMAITDLLDIIDINSPDGKNLFDILSKTVSDILRVRDKKSGVWYQVLDSFEEGNYKEATCSCMFAYTINKAISRGYFDKSVYAPILSDITDAFFREFIRTTPHGTYITNCCGGAGLGPDNHRERDGSLKYYFSEKTRDNDFKGVGPFLMLAADYCL